MSPKPPPRNSPPKVHFDDRSNSSQTIDCRTMDDAERASVDHFEAHARSCHYCRKAYERFKKGKKMCHTGAQLANDASLRVYRRQKVILSTRDHVRLSLSDDYEHIHSALKLCNKHGPGAFFGHDDKAAAKQSQRSSQHASSSRHHHHHASHHRQSDQPVQDQRYVVVEPHYAAHAFHVPGHTPSATSTSSEDSRRPRYYHVEQPRSVPRSESVVAKVGSRLPAEGTYTTVDYVPASSGRVHRR